MLRAGASPPSRGGAGSGTAGGSGGGKHRIPMWVCVAPLVFFGAGMVACFWILMHHDTTATPGTDAMLAPSAMPGGGPIGGAGGGGVIRIAAAGAVGGVVVDSATEVRRSSLDVALDAAASSSRSVGGAGGAAPQSTVSRSRAAKVATSSAGFQVPVIRHALAALTVTATHPPPPTGTAVDLFEEVHRRWPAGVSRDLPLWVAGAPRFPQLFSRDMLVSGLVLTERTAAAAPLALRRLALAPPSADLRDPTLATAALQAAAAATAKGSAKTKKTNGARGADPWAASEAARFGERVLRAALELGAATQGAKYNRWTGEEPGKIAHQIPGAVIGERDTAYAATDTTALWLVALARYWLLTRDIGFVERMEPHVDRALAYVSAHLAAPAATTADTATDDAAAERVVFVEDPNTRATPALTAELAASAKRTIRNERLPERFALRVTYWKDSFLYDRVASRRGAPHYPVVYTLVHVAYLKALRSALALPLHWSNPRGGRERAAWQRAVRGMRHAVHSHLFNWSTPKSAAADADGAKSRKGFLRIGYDAQGVLRGLSSDTLHALWFLDPTGDPTARSADDRPDLTRDEVDAIARSAPRLATAVGYRARYVRPPKHKHKKRADEGAALTPSDGSVNGKRGAADASDDEQGEEEDDDGEAHSEGADATSAAARKAKLKAKKKWSQENEYHGNAVWPFEQAIIHQSAKRFGLKSVAKTSGKMRHALHTLHKTILRRANEARAAAAAATTTNAEPASPTVFGGASGKGGLASLHRLQRLAAASAAAAMSASSSAASGEPAFFPEYFRPEDDSPDRERWAAGGCTNQLWTVAAAMYFSRLAAPGYALPTSAPLWLAPGQAPPPPLGRQHKTQPLDAGATGATGAAGDDTPSSPAVAAAAVVEPPDNRPICERYPHLARGVSQALLARYCPTTPTPLPLDQLKFACLGNPQHTIPLARVNDGYCDCTVTAAPFATPIANGNDLPDVDGSDEPGTSACSLYVNTRRPPTAAASGAAFTCTTSQHPLPTSMVGDGLCDCCDGSDEAEAGAVVKPAPRGSKPQWCAAVLSNCK